MPESVVPTIVTVLHRSASVANSLSLVGVGATAGACVALVIVRLGEPSAAGRIFEVALGLSSVAIAGYIVSTVCSRSGGWLARRRAAQMSSAVIEVPGE